jgi:hypothetical protein
MSDMIGCHDLSSRRAAVSPNNSTPVALHELAADIELATPASGRWSYALCNSQEIACGF